MGVNNTPGLPPGGGQPPRLPPGGRVPPSAPTVRVRPATAPGENSPVAPRVPAAPFTPRLPAAPAISAGRSVTTRLAEAVATARQYEPPAPLVNPLRHPGRWLAVTAFSLVTAVVFAHLAALFITGLYYLVFEASSSAATWWHTIIPDSGLRHTIVDAAEGFYGGAVAQQLVWNPFANRRARYLDRPANWLDRLEDRLRIPNLRNKKPLSFWQVPCALLIWAPVYGSPGFTAAYLLDSVIRHDINLLGNTILALTPHASMWQRAASMDTSGWDMKIVGLAASFCFARRPLRKVFDQVQLWSAQRHVARHLKMHWYHPPTFRARCAQVSAITGGDPYDRPITSTPG